MRRLHPPADAALFRRLRLAALAEAPHAFGSTLARERDRPLDAFAERLASSVVLAAFLGDDAVAIGGVRREDDPYLATLWGLHVAPQARRQGIGRALLDALVAAAPEGVREVRLTVAAANAPALALYERAGFRRCGMEDREVVMRKEALLF